MKRLMRGKDIFSIFRQHNILEYKNPNDTLNIRVISKVIGYANFYIGLAAHKEDRPRNEVSISIFRAVKNPELFRKMMANGTLIVTKKPGIYHVKKLTDLPFQIVITDELEGDEYAAFRALSDHADKQDVKLIIENSSNEPDVETKEQFQKLIEFIASKNAGIIQNLKGGNKDMSSILMEIMKPEIDNLRKTDLFEYVLDGGMSIDYASRRVNLTVEQFQAQLDEYLKEHPEKTYNV